MGFLERMVSDLVRDATGINTRKIKRMVGGKGLLAMGAGAAIAGGLGAFGKDDGQGISSWGNPNARPTAPPPAPPVAGNQPPAPPVPGQAPPPAPAAAAPPPLPGVAAPPLPGAVAPPLPGAPDAAATTPPPPAAVPAPETDTQADASEEPEASPELTYAIVRTMVAAALADGDLAASEKNMIQSHLGDSGLGGEQVQQVQRDLVMPPTPAELAELTHSSEDRQAMYRFGAFVLLADGNIDDLERSWLDRIAEAFGFSAEQKAALEAEIFA